MAVFIAAFVVPALALAGRSDRAQTNRPRLDTAKGGDLEGYRKGEERRRARRQTKEARDERRRSRTAFGRLSRTEAIRTMREKHPEVIEQPIFDSMPLREGERVEKYVGDFGARIKDKEGKRRVLDSTLPLRSDLGSGDMKPVDLALADRGASLEPKNALVRTKIQERLGDGIRFPGGDLGLRLQSPSPEARAEVVENRAFYGDALPDINAAKVLDRVTQKGAPFPGYKGGGKFDNSGTGMVLPRSNADGPITYRKWDVNPYIKGQNRGPERLVTGSEGSAYSTRDHYESFVKIR